MRNEVMMKYKILAADDEVELLDILRLYFEKENMDFFQAKDGLEAIRLFEEYHPDIVMLDIMMPGKDGLDVLKYIRKKSKIPAIMVTARMQDYDKILGLELGADDYITKPYNPLEVVARVKAQLRRNYDYLDNTSNELKTITIGDITLQLDEGNVICYGSEIPLTGIEFHILKLLMENPGRIYTKAQIFNQVWQDSYLFDNNTIMVHMSNIRKKIERDPAKPQYLKTVKGLGYKFEKGNTDEAKKHL
jgi:DNA-binding response OmpR family regulator